MDAVEARAVKSDGPELLLPRPSSPCERVGAALCSISQARANQSFNDLP